MNDRLPSLPQPPNAATRWYSARRVRPLHSGVYEFCSTLWPDLIALDFDQRKGWGKFQCVESKVMFRRYRPRLFDAWRGKVPASTEEMNMHTETQVIEQWLPLSNASSDLADGWYRIEPSDRFGPYGWHVRGHWLVMLKTGERVELPAYALKRFHFDAQGTPDELRLPSVDRASDPVELTGTRQR